MSETKRPAVHGNVSNLSTMTNSTAPLLDHNDTSIGVLHGISLPVGTHSHSSKTVSFDEDVEELENLVMWGEYDSHLLSVKELTTFSALLVVFAAPIAS